MRIPHTALVYVWAMVYLCLYITEEHVIWKIGRNRQVVVLGAWSAILMQEEKQLVVMLGMSFCCVALNRKIAMFMTRSVLTITAIARVCENPTFEERFQILLYFWGDSVVVKEKPATQPRWLQSVLFTFVDFNRWKIYDNVRTSRWLKSFSVRPSCILSTKVIFNLR